MQPKILFYNFTEPKPFENVYIIVYCILY